MPVFFRIRHRMREILCQNCDNASIRTTNRKPSDYTEKKHSNTINQIIRSSPNDMKCFALVIFFHIYSMNRCYSEQRLTIQWINTIRNKKNSPKIEQKLVCNWSSFCVLDSWPWCEEIYPSLAYNNFFYARIACLSDNGDNRQIVWSIW